MPIMVPNAQQVELQTLSLPGASPIGDGGLGAIAQGAGVAADQLRAAEVERQKKRDVTRVFEAEAALGDMERDMRTRQQARRGSQAYGVTGDVSSWWESEPAKISAGLENEVQRTLFAEAAARRREISLNSFSEHEARESNSAVNDSMDARDVNSINYGAANSGNAEAVARARQDIIETNAARARFNGLPPDQAEAAKIDALTKLHSNIIENIAEDDPETASAYFEANKGEIAGSVHDALRTKLKGSKDVVAAQRTADRAWAQGLPETQALDWVRKNSEGQEREHALSLVRAQYADQEAAKTQYERAEQENARAAFNDGGLAALTPRMISVLERTSPGELRWMRSQTPQDQVTTNWDVYQGLIDMANNPAERNSFRDDTNLAQFRGDLNQAELTRLQNIQDDLKKGIPSSPLTLNQIVANYTADLDKAQQGQLENDVTVIVEDLQKRLNRKLTNEEMQGVVEQRMMEVSVPDAGWFWFDAKKPLFELTDDETVAVAYDAIPSAMREEAEADLKASGREPSPANVVALYRLFLEQGNQ